MTNRERIEENYEDAFFAIWMDDFTKRRSEHYLKEIDRLKGDPEAAVSEDLQRKNLNLIYRELRKKAHTLSFKKFGNIALRFVATAAILAALLSCAYAFSPEFRAGTLNVLIQLDEKAASFQLSQNKSSVSDIPELMPSVAVGWLPEGYNIGTPVHDRIQTTIDCTDANDNQIRVRIFAEHQSLYTFDVENANFYEKITIHGHPALAVQKNGMYRISWVDESLGMYFYVESDAVDKSVLIHVAEDISVSW